MTSGSVVPGRVALVDPGDFTPPYDAALVGGLASIGWEPRLYGMMPGPMPAWYRSHFYAPLRHPLAARLPRAVVRVAKGLYHGLDLVGLARELDRSGAEVLHWQWMPLPLLDRAALAMFRRRMPVVLTLHDSNPYNGAGSALMRWGYEPLLRGVDAVIVHTRQAQARVVGWGVDAARIHRVPHGPLGPARPLTPKPPRADGRVVLLQFGKIKPYKGVDVLLDALARLPQEQRDRLDVRIVGEPYVDTTSLERAVSANGLGSTVTFRFGFVDDAEMDRVLAEADALLLPYREIDASGVAMTAIARGLPVLASSLPGFVEALGDGAGVRFVAPGDPRSLADGLAAWAAAPEEVAALAARMAAYRDSVPDWTEIARRTVGVYGAARATWARGTAVAATA